MKWSMIVLLVLLCGCSFPYAHRPCELTTSEVLIGAGRVLSGSQENEREAMKIRKCYPECRELISAELWDCITEIDLREGYITEEQFKKYRKQIHSSFDMGGQSDQH